MQQYSAARLPPIILIGTQPVHATLSCMCYNRQNPELTAAQQRSWHQLSMLMCVHSAGTSASPGCATPPALLDHACRTGAGACCEPAPAGPILPQNSHQQVGHHPLRRLSSRACRSSSSPGASPARPHPFKKGSQKGRTHSKRG